MFLDGPRVPPTNNMAERARFEVARFAAAVDRAWKNSGDHHNPKRQRGTFANTAEGKKRKPSLTRRVGIGTNAQLQN